MGEEGRGVAAAPRRDLDGGRGRIPGSTYRLQLTPVFGFRDAERVLPYLAELGTGDVYASPFLKASPGSTHGYDVVDYGALNPEFGDQAAFDAFAAALRRHGLGLLADFVPNHMGVAQGRNAWWQDVLENGQASPYAGHFDVDWRPLKRELRGKVLLPVLGDHYGVVLERGELALRFDRGAGSFTICYYETPLPIAPPTYPLVLRRRLDALAAALPPDDPCLLEYQSIVAGLERLPANDERDPDLLAERRREQTVAKRRLADLVAASPEARTAIEDVVRELNGTPADPRSFDGLDALLEAQAYRLAYWRVAAEEINYRRFFAINELAAVRQEEPAVFDAAHALLLRLLAAGTATGVRIDHPDGLWDPAGYLRCLQGAHAGAVDRAIDGDPGAAAQRADPTAGNVERPLYVVVEKILEHGEELPEDWAAHGTTGYDFAAAVGGLFVDPAGRTPFDEIYARFAGGRVSYANLVYETKRLIMRVALASEVNVLAQALNRISEQDRRSRDFTLNNLRDALRETIACFPVYRTYVACEAGGDGALPERDRDRRYVEAAIAQAKRRNPAADPSVFDFLRDVLLLHHPAGATAKQRLERCRFAMKLQQLTGPVMAKGVEDTAFYRYNRLLALNEVGADPTRFGTTVAAFHRQNAARRERWPHALLATSTHDTKRSEDVRARIAVLSELPREWRAALTRWSRLNRRHKTRVDGQPAPSRNDEYALYQTLLGAWPAESPNAAVWQGFIERIAAWALKASLEAQVHTSWINPNEAYDAATQSFVRAILDPAGPFVADAAGLRAKVAHFGAFNALSQQLLKLTSPGVPDVYQGTELWDFGLVDPDNRRPVDYARRTRLLRDLRRRDPRRLAKDLVTAKEDGRIKLWLTHRALCYRQTDPDLFALGDYVPLAAHGRAQERLCAFARRAADPDREVIVAVPRLIAGLCRGELVAPVGEAVWAETTLAVPGPAAGRSYRNALTGEVVRAVAGERGVGLPLAEVFATFPVALLERVGDGG